MEINYNQLFPYLKKVSGVGAITLITLFTLINFTAQAGTAGLTPALVTFFSGVFGDVVAGPLVARLLSGNIHNDELEEIIKKFEKGLFEDEIRHDLAELYKQQETFTKVIGVALQIHENSIVERILKGIAVYHQEFNGNKIIREFQGSLSQVNPEYQYVSDLIYNLSVHAGLLQYINLRGQAIKTNDNSIQRDEFIWHPAFSAVKTKNEESRFADWRNLEKSQVDSIQIALRELERFVLVGEPGAGKTTTLRRLALETAWKYIENNINPLPVYIRLQTWKSEQSLDDFLLNHWRLQKDLKAMLKRGDAILFLDGLNEMGKFGKSHANDLKVWLNDINSPKKVVVTCREQDYDGNLLLGIPVVIVELMNEEQIRQFIRIYLGDRGSNLIRRIFKTENVNFETKKHLYELARNPFLLTCLIFIFQRMGESGQEEITIPSNMGKLLETIVHTLWRREVENNLVEFQFGILVDKLAQLAFDLIDKDQGTNLSYEDAVKHIGNEIIIKDAIKANYLQLEGEQISFYHQLIQEYFAALKVKDLAIAEILVQPTVFVLDFRVSNKWDQVIIALSGILENADEFVTELATIDPWLASDCLHTGINVSKEVRETAIINALLNQFNNSDDTWLLSTTAIHLAKYGVVDALPKMFEMLYDEDEDEDVQEAAIIALRIIGEPAIEGLKKAIEHERYQVRNASVRCLIDIAIRQLEQWDDDSLDTYFFILECFNHENSKIRAEVLWEFDPLWDEADEIVCKLVMKSLNDPDSLVRYFAADFVGRNKYVPAVSKLIELLSDQSNPEEMEWRVGDVAADALLSIGTDEAKEAVEKYNRENSDTSSK